MTAVGEHRDEHARLQITTLRYEVEAAGETTVEERPWLLHWYSQDDFADLARTAGLTVTKLLAPDGSPADPASTTFAFWLTQESG